MRIPRNLHIMWFVATVFLAVVGAPSNVHGQTADSDEAAGQVAEQASKPREAFTRYLLAFQHAASGSDAEQRLREKIIKVTQQLKPAPQVPEDAKRYVAYGREAARQANFADVITNFEKAIRAAPWLPEPYYNLGIAQNNLGKYDAAIYNLKLYLLAAPGADDAEKVQDLIYKIEYDRDKNREKEKTTRDAELQKRLDAAEQRERILLDLSGSWRSIGEAWSGIPLSYEVEVSGISISITSGTRGKNPDCRYYIEGILAGADPNGNIPFSGTITGCFFYQRCKRSRGDDICSGGCCLPKHTVRGHGTIRADGRYVWFAYNDPEDGFSNPQTVQMTR